MDAKKFIKATGSIVALIVIILVGTGCFGGNEQDETKEEETSAMDVKAMSDYLLYVRYNGRTYYHTYSIDNSNFESLKGDYLGSTENAAGSYINTEKYSDSAVSNVGEFDIYQVKGYDADNRIMALHNNVVYCFDCYSEMNIAVGADFYEKSNIKNQIIAVTYKLYNQTESKAFNNLEIINKFIENLYTAQCVSTEKLNMDMSDKEFIRLDLELADKTISTIRLYEDGYTATVDGVYVFYMNWSQWNSLYAELK